MTDNFEEFLELCNYEKDGKVYPSKEALEKEQKRLERLNPQRKLSKEERHRLFAKWSNILDYTDWRK